MRRLVWLLPLVWAACASAPPATAPLLAIDLMRTLPGEQADYLRFFERNWAAARAEVQRQGDVVAYEVIAREPDGVEWDVMLVTEYASREAFDRREATFGALFERPEFTMKPVDGKGPRDMAEFVGSSTAPGRRVLGSG